MKFKWTTVLPSHFPKDLWKYIATHVGWNVRQNLINYEKNIYPHKINIRYLRLNYSTEKIYVDLFNDNFIFATLEQKRNIKTA